MLGMISQIALARVKLFWVSSFSLLITLLITVSVSKPVFGATGDVLDSFQITNIADNASDIGQNPSSPHGITFHDGFLWALDFGTDRVYRVYLEDTVDTFGNPVSKGDSDFNIPVSELTQPNWPNGSPMGVCGAYPGDQYCGGGGLVEVNGFLWNASPVTDNILKIDPTDGEIQSSHLFTNHSFPSPSSLTYDGTHFWVIDWQTNTISKVLAETGEVLAEFDGPNNFPDPRPTGITWDGLDLWLSYEAEERVYRVRPTDTPPLLDILDFFEAPGVADGGARPKGLGWDGEFLWHADSGTGRIYKIETDIMPFGVTGCIMKNNIGLSGEILMSQPSETDQVGSFDNAGCFQFSQFTPGAPISISLSEQGVNGRPYIELNKDAEGSTDVILIQHGPNYNEADYDYVASDIEDGNLHDEVTATPNVIDTPQLIDTSVLNETGILVEYNVTDSDGNHAIPVYRRIYVLEPDITPPVITLNGSSSMTIEQDPDNPNLYIEPGATATDDRDGDITSDIVISGTVNSSVAGIYSITYSVSDSAGNASTETRTVEVRDTSAPVITLQGGNPYEIEKSANAYVDPGATATDNVDGTIVLDASHMTGTVLTNVVGTYTVIYRYSDSGGNQATATRTVNVVDTGAPTITLNGPSTIQHEITTPYTDAGATVTDDLGEILQSNLAPTGTVNVNVLGSYELTFNASDASGNAAPTVIRTVIVTDSGVPTITLIGNSTITIEQGSVFNDPGANASDSVDDDAVLTANIVVTGSVDTAVLGSYTLNYDVTDSSGNAATTVSRIVQVVEAADTIPPVITLTGASSISVEQYTTFSDPGATAADNVDDSAAITANIMVSGVVNTGVVGTYTLNYNVSDSSGNAAATVSRTVNVTPASDSTPPVITLIGNSSLNIAQHASFNDPGAMASDNVDDNATLTANIVVTGTVDSSVLGTYTLTYNVSDSAGNAAVPVARAVNVIANADTTPPVISLVGNQNMMLEQGATFSDPGATATDNIDDSATITANIITSGSVNTSVVGTYILNYDVFDAAGNAAATVSRTVQVVAAADTTPPTITLLGANPLEISVGGSFSEPGYTANDNVDGNITGNVSVNSSSVNVNVIGSYSVTYSVADSAGNPVTVVRTVNVVAALDTTPPTISLLGSNSLDMTVGEGYNEPGYSASDNVDGIITGSVIVDTSALNTNAVGSYSVTYNVSDSAGNAATTVSRIVNVNAAPDSTPPTITLQGANPQEITVGGSYVEQGATATDNVDGNVSGSIVIDTGSLNTNAVGSYSVAYNVSDSSGNAATTIYRTVNVNAVPDTTPPTISLLGNNPQEIVVGGSYVELGATAWDNLDGDVSGNISINAGAVNTNSIGSYLVTYNVSDAAGNAAITATRTVNVVSATTTYSANPSLAVGSASVSTTLSIADNKQIADLNVYINMPHEWPGDVSVVLTSPSGTSVTIIDRPGHNGGWFSWGCGNDNFNITLDDEAGGTVESTCPPQGTLRPNNALSAFDGESSQGTWILRIDDAYDSADDGTLSSWSLIVTQ